MLIVLEFLRCQIIITVLSIVKFILIKELSLIFEQKAVLIPIISISTWNSWSIKRNFCFDSGHNFIDDVDYTILLLT